MSLVLESPPLPLHIDADGVIRVAHTRVTLETVIAAFAQGATAEQIAQDYPVVPLADIYAVITFYLRQPEAVNTYLAEQHRTGQHLRRQREARFDPHGIRDRLLARRTLQGQPVDSEYFDLTLLEHPPRRRPVEIMADTAGVSEVVFGVFGLLGAQVSPRLADSGEARLWRRDPPAEYGVLTGLAWARVHPKRIRQNGDAFLRSAGSLPQGTVSAAELMRSLLRRKRPATLARARAALERIPKTRSLCTSSDEASSRRRILTPLNRGESRHRVARAVFQGPRGALRQR